MISGASELALALDDAATPITSKSPTLPVGTVTVAVVAVTDAPAAPAGVPTSAIAIQNQLHCHSLGHADGARHKTTLLATM